MNSCSWGMQNKSKTHIHIGAHYKVYIYMHILYIYIDNSLAYKKKARFKKELTRTQSGQDLVEGSRA